MAMEIQLTNQCEVNIRSPQTKVSGSIAKRNRNPSLRVVGSRVYDPVLGKTCHQCRQKTRDFVAACTDQVKDKPCPVMYCHKCLLNRYGENAEVVAASGDWTCPRCRGICNCSICMKKRGHHPTGILINTAKKSGFSSVSEMLQNGGGQPNPEIPLSDMEGIVSTEFGKNVVDNNDAGLPNEATSKAVEKKRKVNRVKGSEKSNLEVDDIEEKDDRSEKDVAAADAVLPKKATSKAVEKKRKVNIVKCSEKSNLKVDDIEEKDEGSVKDVAAANDAVLPKEATSKAVEKKRKVNIVKCSEKSNLKVDDIEEKDKGSEKDVAAANDAALPKEATSKAVEKKQKKDDAAALAADVEAVNLLEQQLNGLHVDLQLPLGTELKCVGGIDVPKEDVGNALQFLEFCTTFGKILEIKKGQPESVLRDLLHGRTGRRGKFSVTVQFNIHLLTIIMNELDEEFEELSPQNSWFDALMEFLDIRVLAANGLDKLENSADYEALGASEKLKLLNILCDETLGTEKVRTFLDDQQAEKIENNKKTKQMLENAKKEERELKKRRKDEVTKSILAGKGGLSIAEHEELLNSIKAETEKICARVIELDGLVSKSTEVPEVFRREAIFRSRNGNTYWKLSVTGESEVLCQGFEESDSFIMEEKWAVLDDEEVEAFENQIKPISSIEDQISSLREKIYKRECKLSKKRKEVEAGDPCSMQN